jgi:hypothetical protein
MTARLATFQQQIDHWRLELELTPTKQPRPLLRNAIIALRGALEWESVLAYDEFALATMAMKPPPWLKAQDNAWTPRAWTDHDDVLATDWLQAQGIGVPVTVTASAADADNVSVAEILEAIGIEQARWTQPDQNRVVRCLARLGWERYQKRLPSGERQKRYRRAGVTGHPGDQGYR